jgi:hypothetical protein
MELSTRRRYVVSADRGWSPHWSRDGEQIVFHKAGSFFTTRVETEPVFRSEPPRRYLERTPNTDDAPWDLAADGRLLQLTRGDDPEQILRPREVLLAVSHWLAELRDRVPVE